MFGFVIGTISFIALLKVVRSYRHGYRCAGGYGEFGGWHHGGWGHHRHGSWHGRRGWHHGGGWRRMALYSLFERLDATPGQEKVIATALDDLRAKLRSMREQWQNSKHDVAEAFRGDTLTDTQTSELLSPFASHFDELRAATGAAMQKIHEALDPRQRGIFADLMERGWGRF